MNNTRKPVYRGTHRKFKIRNQKRLSTGRKYLDLLSKLLKADPEESGNSKGDPVSAQ